MKYAKIRNVFSAKFLPNYITLLRILLSIFFFLVAPFAPLFYVLYVVCALTDMLDGFLARRWDVVSRAGQCLDSMADLVFFLAVSICVVPRLQFAAWILIWAGIITAVKLSSLVIGLVKFHELSFLHTYENKLTGLLLFLYPMLIGWLGMLLPTIVVCVIASFAAVEEQVIVLRLPYLNRDIKSIFSI